MPRHDPDDVSLNGIVTALEAAVIKKVSLQAVYKALEEGRLAGNKRGGTWIIQKRDLDDWVVTGRRLLSEGEKRRR